MIMYDKIESKILEIDKKISDNINKLVDERGLLASNILDSLRTFCEHIFLRIYMNHLGKEIEINYPKLWLKRNKYSSLDHSSLKIKIIKAFLLK